MSPYKPHHHGVQLKGLNLVFLVRRHGRNFKEVRHPSDDASSIYGRHRIAVVDFNFVSIHLLHSGAYAVSAAVILQRFRLTGRREAAGGQMAERG